MNARILIAEDDTNLGFVIEDHLKALGYEVHWALDGEAALSQFDAVGFDLCLLDVMMPRMDGFNLAKAIRAKDEFVPIIFLTAKSLEEDKLKGFEIGGDDYVTKPFSIKELTHRVRVFLRRSGNHTKTGEEILLGKYRFDTTNLKLSNADQKIDLTQIEADLLKLLSINCNKLVTREEILVQIWGENDYFKGRSLD
ncbi:MAG: response regulator transcription factor, partial [Cyclobacteriaceae bacterium]|nr:response regulator transcription factor [Cyclobacteriaceae bacterium SS2]